MNQRLFGRVAVEGQAMEKFIIASNIGGSKETIIDKKTGFLFDAGNPDDLLEKNYSIRFRLRNSLLKSKEEARNNVIKNLMLKKCVFLLIQSIKKVN